MDLDTFLVNVGFHPDIIAEANTLINSVHTAKINFEFNIGAATSDDGGMLGRYARTIIDTYQGELDIGKKTQIN